MLFSLPFLSAPPLNEPDMTKMVIGIILFLGLVILCLAVMKWISGKSFSLSRGIHLKIIDRMIVARDVQIAVIKVGERLFTVGITKEGVTLIAELDEEDLAPVYETEKTGLISELISRGKKHENKTGTSANSTFLKRFARNFSILSGFAPSGEKFEIPVREPIKNVEEADGNAAARDTAFKDILVKNQNLYEQEADDEEPEAREYEFKEKEGSGAAQRNGEQNHDLNPVRKLGMNGGSGQSFATEGQRSASKKANPAVNMSNYTDAIEKMKSFGDMNRTDSAVPEPELGPEPEPPIKRINEAISRADRLSEPEGTIESVLRSVSKRREKYQKK